jgi:low affinity Fe/Cu permease
MIATRLNASFNGRPVACYVALVAVISIAATAPRH